MAKLVIYVPEQTFEYELSEVNAEYFRKAVEEEAAGENPYALEDMADIWLSDTDPEMDVKFVDE